LVAASFAASKVAKALPLTFSNWLTDKSTKRQTFDPINIATNRLGKQSVVGVTLFSIHLLMVPFNGTILENTPETIT
jgi:hypothetical protein